MRVAIDRATLVALRAALLSALALVEDALNMPRSVPGRSERRRGAA